MFLTLESTNQKNTPNKAYELIYDQGRESK